MTCNRQRPSDFVCSSNFISQGSISYCWLNLKKCEMGDLRAAVELVRYSMMPSPQEPETMTLD